VKDYKMIDCSIIIPVFNQEFLTKQCLDALLGPARDRSAAEIIVVDDGSGAEMGRLLATYGGAVRVVRHERNRGFAASCNDGAASARGRFLVFLNNDTIPLSGWLDTLSAYADARPDAAAVGSKLLFPDRSIQHCGLVICADRMPRHLYVGFPADHPAVNRSRPFQAVTGACLLVRRTVFEELGGFDTTYVNGFEDVDLCLRVRARGQQVHYCYESELFHLASMSEGRTNHDGRNERLYRERWAGRVQPDDWLYYLEDGLIRVDYGAHVPLTFTLSPALGIVVDRDGVADEAERLLEIRARQLDVAMRENLFLKMALARPPAA
jgi:GT2 family glycosyltransferase